MSPKAFVIMPFAPEFDQIYNLFINPTLADAGYDVFRADDIVSQRNILQDIVAAISESDLIVADLTGSNPNVYYELGLAHALRRPVILLTQSGSELPFDLRSYRVIQYDTHFAAIGEAKTKLGELAQAAKDGSLQFGSPVTDFAHSTAGQSVSNQPSVPSIPSTPDEGEPGFLDHLVNVEDRFGTITTVIARIGERTANISHDMEQTTEEITKASQSGNPNVARHLQRVVAQLGQKQSEYADFLLEANDEFASALGSAGESIEFIVSYQSSSTDQERAALTKLLSSLSALEEATQQGIAAFSTLAQSIEAMPKVERNLNRAAQKTSFQIRRFIGYSEQVVAIASRARAIGERILRSSNS